MAYWKHFTTDGQRGVGHLDRSTGRFTGLGMADFLTGRLAGLEHARPGVLDMTQNYLGLYAQDTWRVGTRVTSNGGIRWEPFFGRTSRTGDSNFSSRIPQGRHEHGRSQRAAWITVSGRRHFPSGKSGLNNKWSNLRRGRDGVGCDRRRPNGGALFV